MAAADHVAGTHQRGTRGLARDERRAQIIDTAAGAFLQAGFDGTTMEGVAHSAGVSRLLIYRIFETKQRLYRAVLSSVTDEFVAEFQDRDMADVRRRGGIVRVMLGIARRHPDAFRLLWRQAAQEPAFAEFATSDSTATSATSDPPSSRPPTLPNRPTRHWSETNKPSLYRTQGAVHKAGQQA